MRVVTTLPSATEIVYALGVEPVAVSHACDHPPAAADLPAVERTRVDPGADSAALHEQVVAADREDGVYAIDLDVLAAADPDLIVTQGVCEVCAVEEVLVEEAAERLDLDCEILTTDPHSLGDVFGDVERIGAALGRAERAADLVADLRRRVERVEARVAGRPRPRVAVLDWLDPVMVAGHWMPGIVERAGGEYGLAAPGDHSYPREWAEIRDYDPEVLVAAPCGFGLDRALAEADALTGREGYADLAAVPDRAVALDGSGLVNRPGPRLVDTLEAVAGLLHPGLDDPETDVARPLPVPAAGSEP
ncbi:MAG: ABC transporter substrate-binding protein [Haloferacaceae archaeon]